MKFRFYLDTSIWVDVYEDRKCYSGKPLGKYGLALLAKLLEDRYVLIVTDLLVEELYRNYSVPEVNGMLAPFETIIEKIVSTCEQQQEAVRLSKERKVPRADALHAVIARDNRLVLIARDNHFSQLTDISLSCKPEDII